METLMYNSLHKGLRLFQHNRLLTCLCNCRGWMSTLNLAYRLPRQTESIVIGKVGSCLVSFLSAIVKRSTAFRGNALIPQWNMLALPGPANYEMHSWIWFVYLKINMDWLTVKYLLDVLSYNKLCLNTVSSIFILQALRFFVFPRSISSLQWVEIVYNSVFYCACCALQCF